MFKEFNWIKVFLPFLFFLAMSCASKNSGSNPKGGVKEPKFLLEELAREAESKYNQNDFEEAFQLYTKLVEIDSLNGHYYFKRASSLSRMNNFEDAAKDYMKSAELNYRAYDCYYNLGIINAVSSWGDSTAIYYFEKALEINPNSEQTLIMLKALKVDK